MGIIMALRLLASIVCHIALTVVLYTAEKKTSFGRLNYGLKQCVIGALFGVLAAFSTEYGVDTGGAIMNVRDASALCAGLIFGAPAGLISGVIGGVYRWFSFYWGGGEYTRLACSVSAVIAGVIAALIRKYMFDDRKPSPMQGICIGMICEVFHMLMIFITNMTDIEGAFYFVQSCTLPMVLANGIAVGAAVTAVSLISGEERKPGRERKRISQTFQNRLFICFAIVCVASSGFIYLLETGVSGKNTADVININLEDARKVIINSNDEEMPGITTNWHIGNSGFVVICDKNRNMITDNSAYAGKNLGALGIHIDTDTVPEKTVVESDINGTPYCLAYIYAEEYYIIGAMPKSEALFMRDVSVYLNVFMEILVFAVLFVLIYFLIKKVIIDNLYKINGTLAEITGGNLNVTVDVRTNEEFASLSDDINQTVSTLKHYIAEAAARIDKELEVAREIQYSALPSVSSLYPNRENFEIYAQMIAAKEVGGDFYDFYMLGDSTLAFLVADVSDKGIPAAMFMMQAKTIIKDLAESGLTLSEVFTTANKKLCENNDAGMFVTAWMGILDLKTGLLKFVNAGHNPPLLRQADGQFVYLKARSGMVLAGMDGIKYRQNELQLTPGDQIFLYTDGVTEAADKNNRLYGEERLLKTVNRNIVKGPQDLCKAVKADVDRFVGGAPQFDDITMLSVELQYIRGDNSITVIADDKSILPVSEFAKTLTEKLSVVPKIANKVSIAVDEIYSNIVNYSGAELAEVSYSIKDGKLYISFTDDGIPYNPLKAEEPDLTLPIEEREIGGLGIFLVKNMTESMEYTYEDNKNILRLVIALS